MDNGNYWLYALSPSYKSVLLNTGRRHQRSHVPVVEMRASYKVRPVNAATVPSSVQAVTEYTQSGGHLTDPQNNSMDPLEGDRVKQEIRESSFAQQFPSIDCIFHALVNYDGSLFTAAVKFYIDINFRLANS